MGTRILSTLCFRGSLYYWNDTSLVAQCYWNKGKRKNTSKVLAFPKKQSAVYPNDVRPVRKLASWITIAHLIAHGLYRVAIKE